ncbi:hypothetical protein D3C75_1108690 [compost metagenome]
MLMVLYMFKTSQTKKILNIILKLLRLKRKCWILTNCHQVQLKQRKVSEALPIHRPLNLSGQRNLFQVPMGETVV